MKSIDLLQVQMQWLGIFPLNANQNGKIIRLFLNCVNFVVIFEFMLTTFWYLAFTAITLIEYAQCFYIATFTIVLLVWYVSYLWYHEDFRALFLDLDKIILKSE